MPTIESKAPHSVLVKHRMVIKAFKTDGDMHRFLNKGDNALRWHESTKGLKPGTYAYAGGAWHNVRKMDPMTLAHC